MTQLYIGTYTRKEPHVDGKAEGIYTYQIDQSTGALQRLHTTGGVINPSFVVRDASRALLFAVQEIETFNGTPGGSASAFRINDDGSLELINHQPTHGNHPCYVSIDATGGWLLVANYGGGSVTVFPIGEDGSLGAATDVVQHDGPHPFHNGPHPHSIRQTPDGKYVLVPDCGLDRLYVYKLDITSGKLIANDEPWATLQGGSGPRHIAFSPDGNMVYCINERGSSLTVFAYNGAHGTLCELQTVSTLPEGFDGRNSCADIHIDATGRFVYGSNRGHDSIAIFAVEAGRGTLRPIGHVATGGRTPRNFAIDASGEWLLVANQDTDTIVSFRLDPNTSMPSAPLQIAEVGSPVCIAF